MMATAVGPTQIDLSWTAPSDDGGSPITGYRIRYSPEENESHAILVENTGNTDTTYSDTGLSLGTVLPGPGDQRRRHQRGLPPRGRHHGDDEPTSSTAAASPSLAKNTSPASPAAGLGAAASRTTARTAANLRGVGGAGVRRAGRDGRRRPSAERRDDRSPSLIRRRQTGRKGESP